TARVTVTDVDGQTVHAENVPIAGAGGEAHVPLGVSAPGWYRATLEVLDGTNLRIARRELEFALIGPHRLSRTHERTPQFGLMLPAAEDEELPIERKFVEALEPDFALVPLWPDDFDPAHSDVRVERMRAFVDNLLDARIEPMLVIETVPASVAALRHIDQSQ